MGAIRKCTENFIATVVDDEVLIVDLDGGELFSLSGTGRAVWDAIDGTRSEEAISDQMAAAHAGEREAIAADVAALINDLEKAALVKREG
ncbi:PqqD family protein [Qipengyuania sphaerica]|uniref:PqqD family protein n=1 Tax=Qipengyuania sphaerica TaxID=2867243 RepID=UPI001C8894AE|nr:PqqD family protein [Qipengyuania sphaerica]MBX7541614.1 PqqD family protein [Qipengyuania sphaerica]